MTSTREIKQRIENVSSVEQLVHAMDVVASTKLVNARASVEGVRPIYEALRRLMLQLANNHAREEICHSKTCYFNKRPVNKSLYVILTSDNGMAGTYNQQILNCVMKHMADHEKDEKIIVIGQKGLTYLKRQKKRIINSFYDVAEENVYYGTESIAEQVHNLYLEERVDEVFLCYTRFDNMLQQTPRIEQLLPIVKTTEEGETIDNVPSERFAPSEASFIKETMPLYLHMSLFRAFQEAHASELAARSIAMEGAARNAKELIEELEQEFNRKRQAQITQELTEIVSGAQSTSN